MELPSTPEEPTSVIRIMDDFDNFSRGGTSRRQLSRSRSGRVSALESFSLDTSVKTAELSKEKEIELLTSKAKIAKLENQLKNHDTERKRQRIEEEREALVKERKYMKKDDENQELQKQLKYLLEKEEGGREEIMELKKKLDSLQEKYTKESDGWKMEKKQYIKQLEEANESSRKKVAKLKDRLDMHEVFHYKNQAEQCEEQLALMKSKLTKLSYVTKENTELMTKLAAAEQRCMAAEEALSRQDEAVIVAKAMQGQMTKLKELERQNNKFAEENKLLRDARENAMLLQEKYESMKEKHSKAMEKLEILGHLEIENEELKKKLAKWEIEDKSDGTKRARSPSELTRMVSDLQKSQLSMMEKQGDLLASVAVKDDSLHSLTEKYGEVKQQLLEIQASEKSQIEKNSRLQRKLLWVTTERDGLRRVINSYDTETASNYSPQLLTRVKEAEDRLVDSHEVVQKMEAEMNETHNELSKYRLLSSKLQEELEELKSKPVVSSKASEETSQLRLQIDELRTANENLQEKAEILEAKIEQTHIKGHYDPSKTKVLHFAMNPAAISRKMRAEEFEKLKEENDELHRTLRKLRERGVDTENAESIGTKSDDKELKELKSQLNTSELQKTRLKEAFRERAKTVRESIYHLFGYNHDMPADDTFQILSMYAASPDDKFIFKKSPEGDIQLRESNFASQFPEAFKTYLQRGNSIPAFLSSVTLELFSRQTHLQDTTLAKINVCPKI